MKSLFGVALALAAASFGYGVAATSAGGFVGTPSVSLAASPGGGGFATLFVSAPVIRLASDGSGTSHVTASLWMKGAATSGVLYVAPNGVDVGRLDSAPPANVKPGTASDGWTQVAIDGYLPSSALADTLEPVWAKAKSTYEFSCGSCHGLHAATEYTPLQWSSEMETMARNANLKPDDAILVLKWLQTESLKR